MLQECIGAMCWKEQSSSSDAQRNEASERGKKKKKNKTKKNTKNNKNSGQLCLVLLGMGI
jgi:hypothetical protein